MKQRLALVSHFRDVIHNGCRDGTMRLTRCENSITTIIGGWSLIEQKRNGKVKKLLSRFSNSKPDR